MSSPPGEALLQVNEEHTLKSTFLDRRNTCSHHSYKPLLLWSDDQQGILIFPFKPINMVLPMLLEHLWGYTVACHHLDRIIPPTAVYVIVPHCLTQTGGTVKASKLFELSAEVQTYSFLRT